MTTAEGIAYSRGYYRGIWTALILVIVTLAIASAAFLALVPVTSHL
jgi:hypothetical protein